MATIPCTIVVFTEDRLNFPTATAYVVMKQLFQYGVKQMKTIRDRIFISLTYTPKDRTLKRKFGNLPVRYMRTKLEENSYDEEFKTPEKVVRRYRFNLLDEEVNEQGQLIPVPHGSKRFSPSLPAIEIEDVDEDSQSSPGEVMAKAIQQQQSTSSTPDPAQSSPPTTPPPSKKFKK